jgi:AcrR family transcriptional regulator
MKHLMTGWGISGKEPRRGYQSALRAEQVQLTRDRICEAVVALLDEGRAEGLSVPAIAERSGVSVATIYRHFPNRAALLDGLTGWVGDRLGHRPEPLSLDELEEGTPERFRFFSSHADELRLSKQLHSWRAALEHGQAARDREMTAALAPLTDHLEAGRARAMHGMFRVLFGFDHYDIVSGRFGADAETISEVVGWAARVLLRELRLERGEHSVQKSDDESEET